MLNKSRRWKMSLVRNFLLRALIRCALSCMFLLWLILENFLEQSVCLWFESGPIRVRKQCYYYVPELAKYSAFFLKWHWKLITGQLSFSPFLNPNEVPNKIEVFKKPQVTCNFQVSNYIYLPCKIGYFLKHWENRKFRREFWKYFCEDCWCWLGKVRECDYKMPFRCSTVNIWDFSRLFPNDLKLGKAKIWKAFFSPRAAKAKIHT